MEPTPEPPSVDELIDQLKAKVQEREREGLYPSELAHDLQEHFRRISSQRHLPNLEELHKRLDALDAVSEFSTAKIPLASGMPGGSKLHALVARMVARQTEGILEQMREFAGAVRVVLHSVAEALEEPHGHVHADLVGQIDALFEQVAAFERAPTASEDLRRRIEALEATDRTHAG